MEPTVPWEERIEEASERKRKEEKYAELVEECSRRYDRRDAYRLRLELGAQHESYSVRRASRESFVELLRLVKTS